MSNDEDRNSLTPMQTPAAQPVYMMYPHEADDAIDLGELVSALWHRKGLIVGVTALFAVVSIVYVLLATPIYRAETVLSPTRVDERSNLSSGLGNLASLAGINLGATGDGAQAIAILHSRAFIEEFIEDNNLLSVLFADQWDPINGRWVEDDPESWPDIRDGVKYFVEDVRSISEDSRTGLITLAIEWTDPEVAARWAAELVHRINERMRTRDLADSEQRLVYLNHQLQNTSLVELRQAISRLIEDQVQTIMLAQAETEYAFRVIDPPRIPSERAKPRRALIVVLATFLGGMIGVFSGLTHYAVSNRHAVSNRRAVVQ